MEEELPPLLLTSPAFNPTSGADLNVKKPTFHPKCVLQPLMSAHASRIRSLIRAKFQHRAQERRNQLGLLLLVVVLFLKHVLQTPESQPGDILQLSFPIKDFMRPFACRPQRLGKRAEELDDLCNMIVVFVVFLTRLRVKEKVAGEELKDHARHAPDVGGSAPLCTQDDLWRAILPGLDVVCEMVVHPAGIAEIGNLDGDDFDGREGSGGFHGSCGSRVGGGFGEGDARNVAGNGITGTC